jgi:hypothetical protein
MQAHRDLRTNALTLTGSARLSLKKAGTGANFLGSTRLTNNEESNNEFELRPYLFGVGVL